MSRSIICPICLKEFTPTYGRQKYDTKRCQHIAMYLNRPQAVKMGREAAIEHYGNIFDDPLRQIGKSKYMPALRWIYDWCIRNERTTFTEKEIAAGYIGEFEWYTLAAIGRRHDVIHACAEKYSSNPTVWRFDLPGCAEIERLQL